MCVCVCVCVCVAVCVCVSEIVRSLCSCPLGSILALSAFLPFSLKGQRGYARLSLIRECIHTYMTVAVLGTPNLSLSLTPTLPCP